MDKLNKCDVCATKFCNRAAHPVQSLALSAVSVKQIAATASVALRGTNEAVGVGASDMWVTLSSCIIYELAACYSCPAVYVYAYANAVSAGTLSCSDSSRWLGVRENAAALVTEDEEGGCGRWEVLVTYISCARSRLLAETTHVVYSIV